MAAIVSGTVLSSLFYDEIRSQGDQEGYLLGKVVNHVRDNISDSQISLSKVETVIYIYSYIPWPSEDKCYSHTGRVNPTKAITLLQGKHQDLIGWFKSRRNSTLQPSLKEENLHRNLLESLPVEDDTNFLFFLCSSSLSYNKSTHTFDHVLFRRQNGKLQRVPMSVVNLGDTTHTEYKHHGNLTIKPQGSCLRPVIDQFQDSFVSGSGNMYEIGKIRGISSTLHQSLQGLSDKVQKSEIELSALEEEVKLMTYRLLEQEERRRAEVRAREKPASPPPMEVTSPVISPPFAGSRKSSVSRAEYRLRVGEANRRQRQISVDDNDGEMSSGAGVLPEVSLIDLEASSQSEPDACGMLQPVVENRDEKGADMEVTNAQTASGDHSDKISSRTREAASKRVHGDSGVKSTDAFSFLSNMLEKEQKTPDNLPSKSGSANRVDGKPTMKREISSATNRSVSSYTRRTESSTTNRSVSSYTRRTESRGDGLKAGHGEIGKNSSGTQQPAKGSSFQSGAAAAAEVKAGRSRSQRTRTKPDQTLRSRSKEALPATQRLDAASVLGGSRTKSASPSSCRTPLKKSACENGTDETTLSSSPVF